MCGGQRVLQQFAKLSCRCVTPLNPGMRSVMPPLYAPYLTGEYYDFKADDGVDNNLALFDGQGRKSLSYLETVMLGGRDKAFIERARVRLQQRREIRFRIYFTSGPFLRCVFDAQHFNSLTGNAVNQNIVGVHHKLARPLHTPDASQLRAQIKLRGLRDQRVTHFDCRPWVVLSDVSGNSLAVGNGRRLPKRQDQFPILSARLTNAARSAAQSCATRSCGTLGRGSSMAS